MDSKADITAFNNKKELTITDFTGHPDVQACIAAVKAKKPIVSDVLDDCEEPHQYVDLVQKGGGVLGIALVGYVHILEAAGIRFLKLAGTSAGAINTSLMVIRGNKSQPTSEYLIEALSKLPLDALVDGHPLALTAIKLLVKDASFVSRFKKAMKLSSLILALLLVSGFVLLGLQHQYPALAVYTCSVFILSGLALLLCGVVAIYLSSLIKRLKESGFGVNPGNFFYDWVKQHMHDNGVDTVEDLKDKAENNLPNFTLRTGRTEGTADLEGKVVFITSELVTQNKFEFPEMSKLFRLPGDKNILQPAGFVRASMAIPVFFESYYIDKIPCDNAAMQDLWAKRFEVKNVPEKVRFVDGGILSNFPIDLFYNGGIATPRLPTFGIDLDDTVATDKKDDAENWTIGGYIGRMFNTVRYYYDKDFRLKNRILEKGIGKIGVAKFNWLNFFLTNAEKRDLFITGAKAAVEFLDTFSWEDYKNERNDYINNLVATTPVTPAAPTSVIAPTPVISSSTPAKN